MKTLKNIIIFFVLLIANFVFACDACKLQQPEITRNFTHGTGPNSSWDWLIVAVIALITIYTFVYTVKYLVKPGEKDSNHIKHSILE